MTEWVWTDAEMILATLATTRGEDARLREALEERLTMFLEILSAAGGTSDCSDWPGSWINAFCESHEGRSPDTFNRAADLGYTHATYDSDTDHGTVTLTRKGRDFLASRAAIQGDAAHTSQEKSE